MHGLIANIIANAGRSILSDVTESARNAQAPAPASGEAFSNILSAQSIKEASSLKEILDQNPNISNGELSRISQSIKTEILQSQAGLHGERAPMSLGQWTISQHQDPSGKNFLRITDLEQKSMQFFPDSTTFKKVHLLYQIQEHMSQPAGVQTSLQF